LSGFHSRQRQGRPRYFSPWSPDEEQAFRRFATPNELARAISADDEGRRTEALDAMNAIRHLRVSYWSWFGERDYFLSRLPSVLFVGSQENLARDFRTLIGMLGLPAALELPTDDVKAHRNPVRSEPVIDDEARGNLVRWYATEYEFLRLCRERFDHLPTYE
jgi:hypothetical protein